MIYIYTYIYIYMHTCLYFNSCQHQNILLKYFVWFFKKALLFLNIFEMTTRFPLQPQDPNILSEAKSLQLKSDVSKSEILLVKTIALEDKETNGVGFFRNKLEDEKTKLTNYCEQWSLYQHNLSDVENIEIIKGDIRSVIGKAHLVMDERFFQFNGLIDNCEFNTSEKPVTCLDLQGFWDMIYFQVQDVIEKFEELEKRKQNNWTLPRENKAEVKKKVVKKCTKTSTEIAAAAARREAAKKRLAAAKAALKKEKQPTITFDAVFFKVDSPIRTIVEKPKTPSSRSRKTIITPTSANFMHARVEKRITRSSKKALDFESLKDRKIEDVNTKSCLNSENLALLEENVTLVTKSAEENKENITPFQSTLTELPLQTVKSSTKTVGVMTEEYNVDKFDTAIDAIFNQMKIVATVREEMKSENIEKLRLKLEAAEKENYNINSELRQLKQSVEGKEETNTTNPYECHYTRLVEKCKLLQAELSEYERLHQALKTSQLKWKNTFDLFFEKYNQLEVLKSKLQNRSKELEKREKTLDEEFKTISSINSKLDQEIKDLRERTADYGTLSKNNQALTEEQNLLKEKLMNYEESMNKVLYERNKLREEFTKQQDQVESLQRNLQNFTEERQFEQEEFANEKAFFEEEKELLQSQLAQTEGTLSSTIKLLEKANNSGRNQQSQIEDLKTRLEKTRQDMIVLREETDITKANSRQAILEQQRDVIDCETRLRGLRDGMANFLLKLKKSSEILSCDDMPVLSDHPSKTPSKSLVVSALLRRENQSGSSELSPEDKFDRKVEACLLDLIDDVTNLMATIYKNAGEIASTHDQEKKQLRADKSVLQNRVETLKQELTNHSQNDHDVQISLRRRLREVMAERDELRSQIRTNK